MRSFKQHWIRLFVYGLLAFMCGWYLYWNTMRIEQGPTAAKIDCVNNLKQIGLAFRIWEGDHGDKFPFQVSTNSGGALELVSPDQDGFDRNAYLYLKTMQGDEGLATPLLLVCPQDLSKKAATNWGDLRPENVTYRFYCGTNVNSTGAQILAVCPVDGNVLYSDGRVLDKNGKVARIPKAESRYKWFDGWTK